jgi:hypothetical protein
MDAKTDCESLQATCVSNSPIVAKFVGSHSLILLRFCGLKEAVSVTASNKAPPM